MEIEQSNQKDTRYTIRFASNEEKNFVQEAISKSGLSPGVLVKKAIEMQLLLQNNEDSKTKKLIGKIDELTHRLNQMLRAEALAALELETQAEEKLKQLEAEKEDLEKERVALEGQFRELFKQKEIELKDEYDKKWEEKEQEYQLESKELNSKILSLKDKIENDESYLNKLNSEFNILKKQFEDKIKLLNSYEIRELDLTKKNLELEERLKKSEIDHLSLQKLEIDKAVLLEKLESIKKEEALKRENLELKLKHFHLTEKTNGDDSIYKNLELRERKIDDEKMLNVHEEHSLIDSGAVK